MQQVGFRYFKFWGRGLSLAAGIFTGFYLRKAAFYSPMKEEFEDVAADHAAQIAHLRKRD
jgi:hypothetical protein